MTDPSEVKISDAEARAAMHFIAANGLSPEAFKMLLQQVIAARVPDARDANAKQSHSNHRLAQGFNACRARVLEGPEK